MWVAWGRMMKITALQKAAAQAIVNIFETGSVRGNYADVTLLPGDTGQLTYGRSQTTLASGNLYLLIKDYAERNDGAYCEQLRTYLPQLEACDPALNRDAVFRDLLADAGEDPVMHEVQDAFFDRVYWQPALRSADAIGAKLALSAAVIYDSTVHGSWAELRDLTRARYGELARIGEKRWMADYVQVRRNWLATNPNLVLRKTVYRMDAFAELIQRGNWTLRLPFSVRGEEISEATLGVSGPVRVPAGPKRVLHLATPAMTGPDVVWLQQQLVRAGLHVHETGNFDQQTEEAVRTFQKAHDLRPDGIVGPDTRAALEDLSVIQPSRERDANRAMPSLVASVMAASPPPASLGPDAVADIKTHVTQEAGAIVTQIRQIVVDEHQKLATEIAGLGRLMVAAGTAAQPPARNGTPLSLAPVLQNTRSLFAVAISTLVVGISQLRELIDWLAGTPHAAHAPSAQPSLPAQLRQLCEAVRAFMAALPPEWAYRIRVAGFLLLCYVLYLLIARHFDIERLKREIEEGERVEKELASLAKPSS
jgi:chitosanase